jgi:hypothetical protein
MLAADEFFQYYTSHNETNPVDENQKISAILGCFCESYFKEEEEDT